MKPKLLAALALAAVLVALVSTLLPARRRTVPESAALFDATTESSTIVPDPVHSFERVVEGRRPIETEVRPSTTAVEPVASAPRAFLSGAMQFADGSAPPPQRFAVLSVDLSRDLNARQLRALADDADRTGVCRPYGEESTDENGGFHITRLCPGPFRVRLTQGRGLRVIDEVVSAPNDDLRILLDGYVVVARTLDARGDECERTRVRAVYQPVDEVGGARPAAVEWSALTDAQGEARFVVSGPGRVTLSARNLEWVAPAHGVALLGPSGTHVVTLNLLDYEPLGSLRVLLTDCETGARITDFCLGVFDARTGEKVLRFCSAECDANGSFPAVPAGSYRIRAEPRFTSEPVYYSTDSSAWADVDVRSETESTAAMCVSLGGRIALRIDGPSGVAVPNEVKNVSVSASLVSGGRPIQLKFRTLDLQGLQVSVYIEIGSECVTENVLKAGRYKLTVTGPGFQDSELFVDVIAERSVPAVCKLLRQQ